MKKMIIIMMILMVVMFFGCSRKRSIPTSITEPTQPTATIAYTEVINFTNTITSTVFILPTMTFTRTMTTPMTSTITPTITRTSTIVIITTPTITRTSTIVIIITPTATRTSTNIATPTRTATPSNCIWCGPGDGYTTTNLSNIIDPSTTCGNGNALRVASTSATPVIGKLILNNAVNVIDTVYIAYKMNKTSNVGLNCLLNASMSGPCLDFPVGGNIMAISYSGALKEVDLYINGVGGYIIIDCIQYH